MVLIQSAVKGFIDSGVNSRMAEADSKSIRFLTAVLWVFGLAKIPVLEFLNQVEL